MKKFIAILICMLLLTTCFVACTKDDVSEDTETQEVSDTIGETENNGVETSDTEPEGGAEDDGIGEAGNNNADGNWTKPY